MVFTPKDVPVLGFPLDEGRLAAVLEVVIAEQQEFVDQPDLSTAEDASTRMVAHLLGADYADALRLVSLATSRALDALVQQTGTDSEDEAAMGTMVDEYHELLVSLLFGWLDGVVPGLRYADVAHKKTLLDPRETDEEAAR